MQDALLSPEGLAILSGADLIEAVDDAPIYVHQTSQVEAIADNKIELPKGVIPCWNGGPVLDEQGKVKYPVTYTDGSGDEGNKKYIFHQSADIFCMKLDSNGEIVAEPCAPASVAYNKETDITIIECHADGVPGEVKTKTNSIIKGDIVLVDYYVAKKAGFQAEITADKFAGNFYIEGETLFRREADGVDMPAEMVIPNGKVQSNFNLTFSNSGDPAVFDFTVDCFPAYTKFNKTKKVLGLIQVIDEESLSAEEVRAACAVG